jgi:hypothetical protein
MTMLMVLYLTTSLLRSGKEKHCLLFLRKIVNKTTDSSSSSQKVFTKPREEESKNVADTQNKVGLVSRHTKVYKNTARGYTNSTGDSCTLLSPWPGGGQEATLCVLAMGMFTARVNTFRDGLRSSFQDATVLCGLENGVGAETRPLNR